MAATLRFETNPFGGVVVDPEALPLEGESFRRGLEVSVAAWREEGYRVVWLELPISRMGLAVQAVESGFGFHHSGDDYLLMTLRLEEGAFIPPYASHYIGAGGVVISDGSLLVVHERRGPPGGPRHYKLPGGALHEGEHLVEGVVREVLEETGVRTRFQSLVCFRNLHGYRYGKSDIYFVCKLEALSHEIVPQAEEIEECLWMPLEEYLAAESVSVFNKSIVRAAIESPGLLPEVIDGYRDPRKYEVFMPRV